ALITECRLCGSGSGQRPDKPQGDLTTIKPMLTYSDTVLTAGSVLALENEDGTNRNAAIKNAPIIPVSFEFQGEVVSVIVALGDDNEVTSFECHSDTWCTICLEHGLPCRHQKATAGYGKGLRSQSVRRPH